MLPLAGAKGLRHPVSLWPVCFPLCGLSLMAEFPLGLSVTVMERNEQQLQPSLSAIELLRIVHNRFYKCSGIPVDAAKLDVGRLKVYESLEWKENLKIS